MSRHHGLAPTFSRPPPLWRPAASAGQSAGRSPYGSSRAWAILRSRVWGAVIRLGGLRLLFAVMAVLALAVAAFPSVGPAVPPLPRAGRQGCPRPPQGRGQLLRRPPRWPPPRPRCRSGRFCLPVSVLRRAGPGRHRAAAPYWPLRRSRSTPWGLALERRTDHRSHRHHRRAALTASGLGRCDLPGLTGVTAAAVGIGAGTGVITPGSPSQPWPRPPRRNDWPDHGRRRTRRELRRRRRSLAGRRCGRGSRILRPDTRPRAAFLREHGPDTGPPA